MSISHRLPRHIPLLFLRPTSSPPRFAAQEAMIVRSAVALMGKDAFVFRAGTKAKPRPTVMAVPAGTARQQNRRAAVTGLSGAVSSWSDAHHLRCWTPRSDLTVCADEGRHRRVSTGAAALLEISSLDGIGSATDRNRRSVR
jgi:hypothetical protein